MSDEEVRGSTCPFRDRPCRADCQLLVGQRGNDDPQVRAGRHRPAARYPREGSEEAVLDGKVQAESLMCSAEEPVLRPRIYPVRAAKAWSFACR